MTPRSPGLPGTLVVAEYQANDAGPKPPRILPGAMAEPFAEVRDGRLVFGFRLGTSRHAEVSFSPAEARLLRPMLRAAFDEMEKIK